MYIVYKFIDKYGKVLYIGKSKNFETRLAQHKSGKSSGTEIFMGNVHSIYLKFCSSEFQMDNTEKFYINKYKPMGNSADKYSDSEETVFSLYEDIPWVLYKDNKFSLLEMLEVNLESLKEIGCKIENGKLYKNDKYIMNDEYDLKSFEMQEKVAKVFYDVPENDTKSYVVKFLSTLFAASIVDKTDFKISNHKEKNNEEEIKEVVKAIYNCLRNKYIASPKFRILKKEYYKNSLNIENRYGLYILQEPYCEYEKIKKYISTCSKQINDNFRNHSPFRFIMNGNYYYYDGKKFWEYEKWFSLDYIKEVAEDSSSRGTGNNSFLIMEEYDEEGDNNDSYYIRVMPINDRLYISSIEMFSGSFWCHEYIEAYLDKYDGKDFFKTSIYKDKNIEKLVYNAKELESILQFDTVKIFIED